MARGKKKNTAPAQEATETTTAAEASATTASAEENRQYGGRCQFLYAIRATRGMSAIKTAVDAFASTLPRSCRLTKHTHRLKTCSTGMAILTLSKR